MSDYKRLTKREGKEVKALEWDGEILHRLAELEDKIENKKLVFIPKYFEKYAIIKYTFWKNQPFDIAIYYPCGVKMNGDIEYGFSGVKSDNIMVIEDGFDTKAEAKAKLKELQEKQK